MTYLVVSSQPVHSEAVCPLCEHLVAYPTAITLVASACDQAVCRGCARRQSPLLYRLVELAEEAVRIGRIGRHTVVPPYTALLDLARAADDFASLLPCDKRDAG